MKSQHRIIVAIVLVGLLMGGVGLVGVVYWWGTQGSRAIEPLRSRMRPGMTLVEFSGALSQPSYVWYCTLRPTDHNSEGWVHIVYHRDGHLSYYGRLGGNTEFAETPLDDRAAATLAEGLGPEEWTAEIKMVDPITVYLFDVTFDANHRVKSVSEVQEKAPHD